MPIGAHVGVADGYDRAVDYAAGVGCECLQVFAKSPRRWEAKPLEQRIADAFQARVEETGMQAVLVHTAYLINLGTADPALWERSWRALADEFDRASALGATAVVTHLGTRTAGAPERTASRIAEAIDRAWNVAGSGSVRLLLENTAGAGTTYGSGPAELGTVLHELKDARAHAGICLDTCHAHAAGWDMASPATWATLLADFEACCGMPIEAIHANDCLFPAGKHKDRHAWIGDGTIGVAGFEAMFRDPRLRDLPVVIEMPGEIPVKDAENVSRLKRLRDASAARA
jgi:deoxyribonuclease-4